MTYWKRNDAVIIQCGHTTAVCVDMLRLMMPRHSAYAAAHNMDYWSMMSHPCPERRWGAWDKVAWFRLAFALGYEYIAWIDIDAGIVSDTDLREALADGQHIGACLHDWDRINPKSGMHFHLNVGCMYLRNTPQTVAFVEDWWNRYDTLMTPEELNWGEQGLFNRMMAEEKYQGVVSRIDDKWNATVNVNPSPSPVVVGWHGVYPYSKRLDMMRKAFLDDFIRYEV